MTKLIVLFTYCVLPTNMFPSGVLPTLDQTDQELADFENKDKVQILGQSNHVIMNTKSDEGFALLTIE